MTRRVDPRNPVDVIRKIAREEAQKAVPRQPPISPIQPDNPFLKVDERITKLEARVAELEKRAHSHS